ncbi:MAG: hypothetical protein HY721_34440 [Planctomycetes bacterium]|nr:hypothetical protein [Planctomycetota bacterium]
MLGLTTVPRGAPAPARDVEVEPEGRAFYVVTALLGIAMLLLAAGSVACLAATLAAAV